MATDGTNGTDAESNDTTINDQLATSTTDSSTSNSADSSSSSSNTGFSYASTFNPNFVSYSSSYGGIKSLPTSFFNPK